MRVKQYQLSLILLKIQNQPPPNLNTLQKPPNHPPTHHPNANANQNQTNKLTFKRPVIRLKRRDLGDQLFQIRVWGTYS